MAVAALAVGAAAGPARSEGAGPAASAPASQPAASVPASQPAAERVLVRVGDTLTITQADFDEALRGSDPDLYEHVKDNALRTLVEQQLFRLYVRDHPKLIPDAELDARTERDMRIVGIASFDELLRKIEAEGMTLEEYREKLRLALAKAALTRQGTDLAEDEAAMRNIYETRRPEFDGTTVTARQMMVLVSPTDTPEERAAKRARLGRLREDVVSGRRTWKECVAETDSQHRDGSLGEFTRHLMRNPFLSELAFSLKPGEVSEIFETLLGYHVVEVQDRKAGRRSFESVERNIKLWLSQEGYVKAIGEAMRKYQVAGVQPPLRPTTLGRVPDESPLLVPPSRPNPRATQPAGGAETRPAATRPSGRQPATRPASRRPATRPAPPG